MEKYIELEHSPDLLKASSKTGTPKSGTDALLNMLTLDLVAKKEMNNANPEAKKIKSIFSFLLGKYVSGNAA